jgi:hypothetical protein
MFISTFVWKHLICALQLKEYCLNLLYCCQQICCLWLFTRATCFATCFQAITAERSSYTICQSYWEDVPLAVRERMWHMPNGAPVHFNCAVRNVPHNTYHGGWIGTEVRTVWRWRDLNSPFFSLWELLLTTKSHFTNALWILVGLSVTTLGRTDKTVRD